MLGLGRLLGGRSSTKGGGKCTVLKSTKCGADAGCDEDKGREIVRHEDCSTTTTACHQKYCVDTGLGVLLSSDGL